jgi:hypothetical protein
VVQALSYEHYFTLNTYFGLFGKQLAVLFINYNSVEVLDLILIVKSITSFCMLVCSVK